MRTLPELAIVSELAAKLTARPKLADVDDWLAWAGLLPAGALVAHVDGRIRCLADRAQALLDGPEARQVPKLVNDIHVRAHEEWLGAKYGLDATAEMPSVLWNRVHDETAVPRPPEGTDDEHDRTKLTSRHAQQLLSRLVDNTCARTLTKRLLTQGGRESDLRRLQELKDPGVNHDWVFHIDPTAGTLMPSKEHSTAIRHRLGCKFLAEASTCHVCGKTLDVKCIHAGCCAGAESTKGHYAVVRQLFAVAATVDPTTTKEEATEGEQKLRPGDVESYAFLPGARTAVDVGITSQDSTRPGDCTAHYAREKFMKYRNAIRQQYSRDGICWRAAIFSQEGRPGTDAVSVLDGLASQAARYAGAEDHPNVRRRLAHEVTRLASSRPRAMLQ